MIFQIGVFAEPSVTDVTLERPRPVVHVHVRFQVAGRRERFGAQCAFVRFFLRTHVTRVLTTRTLFEYYRLSRGRGTLRFVLERGVFNKLSSRRGR